MSKGSGRNSTKRKKRRQLRRPAENTTLLAGGSAAGLLAVFGDKGISPEIAAAVTGAVAVIPRIVSEIVSWFRQEDDEVEEDDRQDEDDAPKTPVNIKPIAIW